MQLNIKWNSNSDSFFIIWSFEIIVQISHNTMLSIFDTGMNAPTDSTSNDGKHTWMGKPKLNVDGFYTNEHKPACMRGLQFHHLGIEWSQRWKKYCMIPV